MPMVQHVLLENRLLLFGVWMLVQLALIGVWSWRRSRTANRGVWVGLIALPVLLALSTVVVTQREQLIALCRKLAVHVERGEVRQIAEHLNAKFESGDLDREAFVERLEPALKRFNISNLYLSRFEFDFDDADHVAVELSATCNVRTADAFFGRVLSRWRVKFVRRAGEWYLTSVEVIPTPLSPVRDVRDWIR